MINRILIRIKVVQILYSYLLTQKERTFADAEKELGKSMDKAYELYFALFKLIVDITRMQELRIDAAKNKYLPTDEELNPNTRFIDNAFVKALNENEAFGKYLKSNPISWEDEIYVKVLLDKILSSEIYSRYMSMEATDLKADAEFWRDVMRHIVLEDEGFTELLENRSVYWNDDLITISTFFLKTIRRWGDGLSQNFAPKFKDEQDASFGFELLKYVNDNMSEYNGLIDKVIKNDQWDAERIALMDRVVMLIAIAEILNYPAIPISVSMNEYIEIAKFYSTAKSGYYINGVLNSVVKYLKSEKILCK